LLSAYTFCRPGEIRHAEWSEIDITNAEWRIPSEKMKMKRIHIIPLATQTLEVLETLRPLTGNKKWLFPSIRMDGRPMSENTVSMSLRSMGFSRDEMSAHGFRGMASSILNGHEWNRDVIEMQLAHAPRNKTRSAYNHAEYLSQRRTMMQWWADWLNKI
jgi:integrase